ncbi:MAG: A/G-specific adenine glycosylase [Candidatus Lokiarchaeum sp. GC14_75]|nr:MAG: A/G-specific adenine glycosylase [Candidatus Lokiarchaeum sp. GC14_75]
MLITEFYKLYKSYGLSIEMIQQFQEIIHSFYSQYGRDFPFRKNITPYYVLVSEIMLQQTQTSRVSEKFLKFIEKFPDFSTLSIASLDEVLKTWQGLGYNRRALALKKIANIVITDHKGKLPHSIEVLKSFPQIGHNTASSIITFAFNKPTIFIETNIRRVFIYFFFPGKRNITDKQITPIIEKTLDRFKPREWYYALMDYGVMLKKSNPDLNKRSAKYRKQAPFKGSKRQVRGDILKMLISSKILKVSEIEKALKGINKEKLIPILLQLEKEEFIKIKSDTVQIVK